MQQECFRLTVCSGLLAAVSRIAAILPNDLAPTNMNGPLPTLVVIAAKVRLLRYRSSLQCKLIKILPNRIFP
ncbi:hypothetical protein C1J05_04190 [Sulfitobacter sp. JL08]|nr:hypothetical protein C1J05_04190 [Sulfitobacter sp. JL08]